MKKISFLFFCFFVLLVNKTVQSQTKNILKTTDSDTILSPKNGYYFVRGIEQEEENRYKFLQPALDAFLYFPRQLNYGIHYASGYGAELINDPKFIDRIEDFFFTDDRKFGWYPAFDFISGFRPRVGVNLIFKSNNYQALAKGKYADRVKYKTEARFSFRFKRNNRIWRFTLINFVEYDDDRVFYGIGSNPTTDTRSFFLNNPKKEYGVFIQRSNKFQLLSGLRLFNNWEYFFSTSYLTQHVQDGPTTRSHLSKSFDINQFGGINKWYNSYLNELILRYDNREKNNFFASGIKIEGNIGISNGIKNNKNVFLVSGFDILGSIPVLLDNRVLKPRISFQMVENLDKIIPLRFINYPKHLSFRGVSDKKILRTDNFLIVPSIEYQWPLSFNLGGLIFFDQIIVANKLSKIHYNNPPWAIGLGVNYHSIDGKLAKTLLSYGSHGFRVTMDIGWAIH